MLAEVKELKTNTGRFREDIVEWLESLLVRARAGEIIRVCAVVQTNDMYEYSRRGDVTYEQALAMLVRAAHKLNQDWDGNV